jgi:hypothetical protein
LNSPSSTGKSYIVKEIVDLFPPEDVEKISYATPTAFFHTDEFDPINGQFIDRNLERKILVFWDQPNTELLKKLRPLLSHDEKELILKITDKSEKRGLRTKTVLLRGFPVLIYCTANLVIDEQELTRFIVLAPETDEEKIRSAFEEKLKRLSSPADYMKEIEENKDRQLLKLRIRAIKQQRINQIKIPSDILDYLKEKYLSTRKKLQSIDLRDIEKVSGLGKAFALLNFSFRERLKDGSILVKKEDIDVAIELWKVLEESRDYQLTPYAFKFYKDIFLPVWNELRCPFSFADLDKKHMEIYGVPLPEHLWRRQLRPLLIGAGLAGEMQDPVDKRRKLYLPIINGNSEETGKETWELD